MVGGTPITRGGCGARGRSQSYVDEHLMCQLPHGGQLTSAAIVGQDGGVWAQSSAFPAISKAEVDALKRMQTETAEELDALLPAILDRAFKGRL